MLKIVTPQAISSLPVSLPVQQALSNEILAPVDDIELLTTFWTETGTVLWHLNCDDTLPEDPLLEVALSYPEYVIALDDGWYLLLGIVCDNGQGIYLIFPETTVIPQLQALMKEMDHE